MVFPRPNRPQFEKTMSRDPLSSRDPLPLAPSQIGAGGGGGSRPGGGVPARRGVGVPARGVLRPVRGQEAWEYHEPGPPNEPGPLAFPQLCILLFSLGKIDKILAGPRFSKPIFGHSAGSTKLDQPYCKQFRLELGHKQHLDHKARAVSTS